MFSLKIQDFSLEQTLGCGQFFAYYQRDDGVFDVVAQGRCVGVSQKGDELVFDCDETEYTAFWRHFFALDCDYHPIKQLLSTDATLREAIEYAGGIRILRQSVWETSCCFIISQNNNIKRIAGIVERLCENFGEPLNNGRFGFPSPSRLAACTVDDLAVLRSGFRARYLIDAAKRFSSGEIDEDYLRTAPLADAAGMLMRITGVGKKVAACILLFGAGRLDAFPEDVWIKRAMAELFPAGLPERFAPYAGIAQQYIFHYARTKYIF